MSVKSQRILLVDDDEAVLKSIYMLLQSEGYSVTPVKIGNEAVNLIKTESYDLLITDIRMTPIDGVELINLAKKEKSSMSIIIISAYSSEEFMKKSIDLGCSAYIKKPFKIQEVLDTIKKVLSI